MGTSAPINVGTGEDLIITELAELIADVVGYEGEFEYDCSKPDVTPRKLIDLNKLASLGWTAKIGLLEGIAQTYEWFKENKAPARGVA